MQLNGLNILITGAARRVGAHLACALAQKRATLTLHANHSSVEIKKLVESLGKQHRYFCCDLTEEKAIENLFNFAQERDEIDLLINNAATYECLPFHEENLLQAKKQFEVNFWAPYRLSQHMGEQKKQSIIINLVDHQVEHFINEGSSYGLSKKSLLDLTYLTARDLAPHVRVNALALGPILPPSNRPYAQLQKAKENAPLKRVATLDDVVQCVEFLINQDSITGQILYLDCGAHLL